MLRIQEGNAKGPKMSILSKEASKLDRKLKKYAEDCEYYTTQVEETFKTMDEKNLRMFNKILQRITKCIGKAFSLFRDTLKRILKQMVLLRHSSKDEIYAQLLDTHMETFALLTQECKGQWVTLRWILKCWTYVIKSLPEDTVRGIVMNHVHELYFLTKSLLGAGEYRNQRSVMLLIFQCASTMTSGDMEKLARGIFPQDQLSRLRRIFGHQNDNTAEMGIRLCLNEYNSLLTQPEIVSFPVSHLQLGAQKCQARKGESIWIDFNTFPHAISIYCSSLAFLDGLTDRLMLIYIPVKIIDGFIVNRTHHEMEIIILAEQKFTVVDVESGDVDQFLNILDLKCNFSIPDKIRDDGFAMIEKVARIVSLKRRVKKDSWKNLPLCAKKADEENLRNLSAEKDLQQTESMNYVNNNFTKILTVTQKDPIEPQQCMRKEETWKAHRTTQMSPELMDIDESVAAASPVVNETVLAEDSGVFMMNLCVTPPPKDVQEQVPDETLEEIPPNVVQANETQMSYRSPIYKSPGARVFLETEADEAVSEDSDDKPLITKVKKPASKARAKKAKKKIEKSPQEVQNRTQEIQKRPKKIKKSPISRLNKTKTRGRPRKARKQASQSPISDDCVPKEVVKPKESSQETFYNGYKSPGTESDGFEIIDPPQKLPERNSSVIKPGRSFLLELPSAYTKINDLQKIEAKEGKNSLLESLNREKTPEIVEARQESPIHWLAGKKRGRFALIESPDGLEIVEENQMIAKRRRSDEGSDSTDDEQIEGLRTTVTVQIENHPNSGEVETNEDVVMIDSEEDEEMKDLAVEASKNVGATGRVDEVKWGRFMEVRARKNDEGLSAKEEEFKTRQRQDDVIAKRKEDVKEKEEDVNEKEKYLKARKEDVKEKEEDVKARKEDVKEKEKDLKAKKEDVKTRKEDVKEKEEDLTRADKENDKNIPCYRKPVKVSLPIDELPASKTKKSTALSTLRKTSSDEFDIFSNIPDISRTIDKFLNRDEKEEKKNKDEKREEKKENIDIFDKLRYENCSMVGRKRKLFNPLQNLQNSQELNAPEEKKAKTPVWKFFKSRNNPNSSPSDIVVDSELSQASNGTHFGGKKLKKIEKNLTKINKKVKKQPKPEEPTELKPRKRVSRKRASLPIVKRSVSGIAGIKAGVFVANITPNTSNFFFNNVSLQAMNKTN
ncbi:interaptin-like [Lutzomyia longipalpis]|uniref:interaptin-like n=1 Tax=Lutzomyia longipalpis TaxID=7200 RepID=UPI002484731E|nr:interaptin-like [Lutzomyia longipalpis]